VSASIARGAGWGVLYDPDLVTAPDPGLFDQDCWAGALTGHAGRGRGQVLFLQAGDGQWALRHYRRGGLAGRLVRDRYAWLGEARSRSWREWRLLARLHAEGLPVPRPVAAGWQRRGPWYRADLLTVRIPGAVPLSARLAAAEAVDWEGIGRVLEGFQAAGAWHADLNAHNILLDAAGAPWLLDFDRGRIRPPGRWQARTLARLERSLRKIAREPGARAFDAAGWAALCAGYRAAADLRLRFTRASGP
jgi:3-deoxy-D-manno-octulosonic acid kinase